MRGMLLKHVVTWNLSATHISCIVRESCIVRQRNIADSILVGFDESKIQMSQYHSHVFLKKKKQAWFHIVHGGSVVGRKFVLAALVRKTGKLAHRIRLAAFGKQSVDLEHDHDRQ